MSFVCTVYMCFYVVTLVECAWHKEDRLHFFFISYSRDVQCTFHYSSDQDRMKCAIGKCAIQIIIIEPRIAQTQSGSENTTRSSQCFVLNMVNNINIVM